MVFESLHKLKSKPERVLLIPQEWIGNQDDHTQWMLNQAVRNFRVKLQPVQLIGTESRQADGKPEGPGTFDKPSGWSLSITKVRIFELVQYKRVLHLDSDITLLQHMDELFLLPETPIAMPRAYWSDTLSSSLQLTSLLMLIEPNAHETAAMLDTLRQWGNKSNVYDMDLLNHRFGTSAMVLPHRPYAMLTAEFRNHNHSTYLGSNHGHKSDPRGQWDPDNALREAKLVHFSDWPLPKPWIMWPAEGLTEMQPRCGGNEERMCKERVIWIRLYENFRARRKALCRVLPVPAPNWEKWKGMTGAGGS